jgi:hypothetical protein
MRNRLHRWLRVGLTGLTICVVLAAQASCSVRPDDSGTDAAESGEQTTQSAGEPEQGGPVVESGQSEQGPLGPVATVDLDTVREQVGESGGGFWTLLQAGEAAGEQTYRVGAGADFRAAFTIGNYEAESCSLRFMCILDSVQIPCVEGETEKAHRVELGAQSDTTLQLRVSDLTDGLHDLVLAMFFYPDEHSTAEEFRKESRFMYACDRATLYVGQSKATPSLALVEFSEGDEMAAQGLHTYAVSKRGGAEWEDSWQFEEAKPGESLEYYITRNNPEERTVTYAFLAFLDYEQVPIDGEHLALYARVPSQARAMARGTLVAPSQPGEHEFVVLVVDNPFLDQGEDFASSDPMSFETYPSDRVLIRVG